MLLTCVKDEETRGPLSKLPNVRQYGFAKFQDPPLTHKPLNTASLGKMFLFPEWTTLFILLVYASQPIKNSME